MKELKPIPLLLFIIRVSWQWKASKMLTAYTFKKHRQELYELNCKRLEAIIDCVVLCGKQNIPLCGHHDANVHIKKFKQRKFLSNLRVSSTQGFNFAKAFD